MRKEPYCSKCKDKLWYKDLVLLQEKKCPECSKFLEEFYKSVLREEAEELERE